MENHEMFEKQLQEEQARIESQNSYILQTCPAEQPQDDAGAAGVAFPEGIQPLSIDHWLLELAADLASLQHLKDALEARLAECNYSGPQASQYTRDLLAVVKMRREIWKPCYSN